MAKITIEAADVYDLLDTIAVLRAAPGNARDAEPEIEDVKSPQAETAPKPRGRPRKTDAAPATPVSGDQAPSAEAQPGSGSGQTATTAASPSDLEAALMEGAAEEPASEITAQDVMSAMHAHIEKHGAPNTLPVLEKHGAGAKSFKQIQPEHYAAVHAALTAGL